MSENPKENFNEQRVVHPDAQGDDFKEWNIIMGWKVSCTRFLPTTSWIWQWNGKDSEMIPLVKHSHWMWVCWGKNGNKAKPHVSRCFWNNKRSWRQIWRRWQLQWQSMMLKFLDWTSYCSRPNTGTRLGCNSSQRKSWFEGTSSCLDCWIQKSHRWSEGHDQKKKLLFAHEVKF